LFKLLEVIASQRFGQNAYEKMLLRLGFFSWQRKQKGRG